MRDLERADAAVAEAADAQAAAAWAEAADEAARTLASARQAALDAEEDVAFAERNLALPRLGLREALATWRERDTFYRDWNRYLLEAERFWSAAGAFGGAAPP